VIFFVFVILVHGVAVVSLGLRVRHGFGKGSDARWSFAVARLISEDAACSSDSFISWLGLSCSDWFDDTSSKWLCSNFRYFFELGYCHLPLGPGVSSVCWARYDFRFTNSRRASVKSLLDMLYPQLALLGLRQLGFDADSARGRVLHVYARLPSVGPSLRAFGTMLGPPKATHFRVEISLPEVELSRESSFDRFLTRLILVAR
jgi:hypothetical protein